MKRIISFLIAVFLILSLSVSAYAYTIDELLESINGYCANIDDRVFAIANYSEAKLPVIAQVLEQLFDVISSQIEKYDLPQTWFDDIFSFLANLSSFSDEILPPLQESIPLFNKTLVPKVVKSEEWLESLNGWASSIDSDTSALRINSDDLKTGWFLFPQLQRPIAKAGYQNSWYFGVLQSLYNFRSDFAITNMTKGRVEGFNDSDFSHLTFAEGVYSMLYRLQQVLADDDDLQMSQDSEENKNVAKDAFLSYDSDTSVKPSDIGGLSNLGSGLRNNFDTGTVEASNLFDFWGSDNTFSWFTQETKDNMVNVSSSGTGVRRARAQNDEPIYYSPYGEHMEEYERLMREGIK